MSRSGESPEIKSFRKFMRRLGFWGVSIKKVEQLPGSFAVCAFDRMNEKVPFSRVYTLEEMRCIIHASDIFWRYLK
uniref:Uncharacterized protein n=2 Tax=unclassified Microvirus TaxID=338099 RepID=A0AAU8AZK6_9VIRU